MASAEILGYATGSGEWGSYGTTGYWIRSSAGVITQSLPAAISSVACAEGDAIGLTAGDSRAMRIASGSGAALVLQTSGGGAFTMTIAAASESAAYSLSLRLISLSSSRVYTITVKTSDGVTTLATGTTPDTLLGVWARLKLVGSVRIEVTGTFPRYQGVLFDPGAAAYSDPAPIGLALGGDWPASLAIAEPALIGLAIGVGEGMDPTATMVESAWAGLALGGDWSASLAIAEPAPIGLALGGEWTASLGADPATLPASVRKLLRDDPTVYGRVGERIRYAGSRQGDPMPRITYVLPSGAGWSDLDGSTGTDEARVRISVWAEDAIQAIALALAVRAALDGYRGWIGSVWIESCSWLQDVDLPEFRGGGGEALVYQIACDFSFIHRLP